MNIRPISEWTLYRYRFGLGYLLLAFLVLLYIGLQADIMPPGLGPSEKQSVIDSANISLTEMPTAIIDLPYHLLQKASVTVFGVSPLGVRLPSLIIGGFTALMVALILKRWFKTNVAIVAALIVLSSAWFISTVRLGSPFIMVPFWTSLILLATTYIAQETPRWRLWKVVLAFSAALSLYTPFMIYLFIAAIIASMWQPHLRYLVRRSSAFHITIGTLVFLVILAPLGWGVFKDLPQLWHLLAIPIDLPGPIQFGKDLAQAASNLFNPYAVGFGETLTPMLGVASTALLLMGGARLLKDSHSVRTYVLLTWGAVLVPIIGLNPHNLIVLLVPSMLVTAIGVHLIINYWYRLFPRNPYARIFGLLPLAVLVIAIVQFNNQRYVYGMLYSQQAATTFNGDTFLAEKTVRQLPKEGPLVIVAPEGEEPLYRLIAEQRPQTTVVIAPEVNLSPGTWLIAESEIGKIATPPAEVPNQLIVNDRIDNSLRFRLYNR